MTASRVGFHHRVFAAGLTLLMASTFTACVSVKESGTKVSAPPPPPTTSVAFHSDPVNAEVYVDGEFRGTAPLNLHFAAGTHKVAMGYVPGLRKAGLRAPTRWCLGWTAS